MRGFARVKIRVCNPIQRSFTIFAAWLRYTFFWPYLFTKNVWEVASSYTRNVFLRLKHSGILRNYRHTKTFKRAFLVLCVWRCRFVAVESRLSDLETTCRKFPKLPFRFAYEARKVFGKQEVFLYILKHFYLRYINFFLYAIEFVYGVVFFVFCFSFLHLFFPCLVILFSSIEICNGNANAFWRIPTFFR